MSINKTIRQTETYLRCLENKVGELKEEIRQMKSQADIQTQRMAKKMKYADIAAVLNVSERTVYNMLEDGRLEGRKAIDVDNYLKQRG